MKEIKKLKKLARKHRGEESSRRRELWSKLSAKIRLENRPWVISLAVLVGILLIGLIISSIFAAPPTPMPTLLGYPDATPCYLDSDCQSSFCTLDVDGSRYCAPAGSCARKEGTDINIYSSAGTFASDMVDPDGVGYRCDMGFWSEDPFSTTNTFSKISFAEPGTDSSTMVRIPKNAVVREASLYIYSIASYQVSLEDDFKKAGVVRGYSVHAKQVEGEPRIILTDLEGQPLGTYEYQDGVRWPDYDFSITTASVDGKTKVILAARGQDSFAIYTIGKFHITNPKVDIGLNGVNWEHSGKLTSASGAQKIDFTADLVSLIQSCRPVGELCNIPIRVSSDSAGSVILSNLKIVMNSPPKITSASLDPPITTYGEPISCLVSAEDIDGDQVSYLYRWYRNGVATDETTNILPPERVQKGDRWTCKVTPLDVYSQGTPVSTAELYVAGLSDYSTCSAAYQCESSFCVNGMCCVNDPCPGDNVCSPGEDGTADDECCIAGDGVCTGGCSDIDTDCEEIWTKTELKKKDAKIEIHDTRNDGTLVVQVVDSEGRAISGATLTTSTVSGTRNVYTNTEGFATAHVGLGDRVEVALTAEGEVVSSADVVIQRTEEGEAYSAQDIQKIGFSKGTEPTEVEWTRADLSSQELVITFASEFVAGEPIVIQVTDANGKPIVGVPVTLETTEGLVTVVTDNLGFANIQEYAGDPLQVRIEKDGYTIASEEVTIVSTRISYWAMIPILILIIPLIVFFVFSTARGRISGFGAKQEPLVDMKPKISDVPKGMNTSAYTKKLHTIRQSPATAQVLKHIERSILLISERDYSGAKQEIDISNKLYAKIKNAIKGDTARIIASKLAAADKKVTEAYKKQLEMVKHAPAAQKILDHMKFIQGRIGELNKIDASLRKSINSQIGTLVGASFVKAHPKQADTLLQEIDDTLQAEIYNPLKDLNTYLNKLLNNLLEAHSDKVLSMEGMSDAEINRKIASAKARLEEKAKHIIEHFKLKVKSI